MTAEFASNGVTLCDVVVVAIAAVNETDDDDDDDNDDVDDDDDDEGEEDVSFKYLVVLFIFSNAEISLSYMKFSLAFFFCSLLLMRLLNLSAEREHIQNNKKRE